MPEGWNLCCTGVHLNERAGGPETRKGDALASKVYKRRAEIELSPESKEESSRNSLTPYMTRKYHYLLRCGEMGSFGENLRREREMRGISLDEIASSTKISIRFLQAMENDEFASLPGGIFRRSFIRSYAKYLGLDEEQVIAEYQMTAQPKDVEISRLMFSSSYGPRPERRSFFLPVLLAVAMVAGAYALFHYAHRPEESPAAAPSGPPAETQAPQERSSPAPASDGGQTMGASAAPAESPSGSASLNTA